jgi:hypothetical protein
MTLAALTVYNVPVLLRSLLGSRGADVSNLRNPRVIALIDTALEALAYRVARGEDFRGLQKEFVVDVQGGRLTRADMGDAVIFDLARSTIREVNTGVLLIPLDSLTTVTYGGLPDGQIYYAPDGTGLRFRDALGSLTGYIATVTLTANHIPVLGQLPVEYQGLFLNTLAGLVTQPQAESRALELSEVGRA